MRIVRTFTLKNELGLHARAAVHMVNVAKRFVSDITFERKGVVVNGRSILGILTLACPKGGALTICSEGIDAAEAMEEFERLIEARFGEE